MEYLVSGNIEAHLTANFRSKEKIVYFGIDNSQYHLPSPAELLLGSFVACCLKNIERFSALLKFEYRNSTIFFLRERQEKPTKLTKLNMGLVLKVTSPI